MVCDLQKLHQHVCAAARYCRPPCTKLLVLVVVGAVPSLLHFNLHGVSRCAHGQLSAKVWVSVLQSLCQTRKLASREEDAPKCPVRCLNAHAGWYVHSQVLVDCTDPSTCRWDNVL